MGQTGTVVRTSSKRSATQLPSPNSPSHQLPPKIPRYRLEPSEQHVHMDNMSDFDPDSDSASDATDDVLGDASELEDGDDDHGFESRATSVPSTPESAYDEGGGGSSSSVLSLADATRLEGLQLYAEERADDEHMDDYALSPSHSRNHSLDRLHTNGSSGVLQVDWAAHIALHQAKAEAPPLPVEDVEPPPPTTTTDTDTTQAPPLTFVTLPPEIRHQIYRNCENLVIDKPLVYCISTFDGQMQHALASVSRLVRSEALAIFYSYNLWVIKVEFKMMYEAFQDWIIRLGHGAGLLRLISFSVRGALFKPKKAHAQSVLVHGHLVQLAPGVLAHHNNAGAAGGGGVPGREELYCPPDGDASFKIDLSEKYAGGRVLLVRNDGTREAGEKARVQLSKMVEGLWEKRRVGTLNGQDWISLVDGFITFIGGW
ncbi:hypothetical protein GMOD_00007441 [Pyrenophora seminiperda CCB06]|uniref:Uncharacterized protein n=1 Tax=Pyrenophora seminiperda CCB06 TaxID=1302712 RepID=A0A3M7MD44_9PLEO|nr:hypothetical protein GMOD_00007441 [Pyrenophora seminiperda CCB06]